MKLTNQLTLAALTSTLLFQTSITRADDARDHRDATVTWTKHVTEFFPFGPTGIFGTIAGVAGGDIGDGTVIGEALNPLDFLPDGSVTFEAE